MTRKFVSSDRQYAYTEILFSELSETLADAVISAPFGEIEERADSALHWRRCLLRGELPRRDDLFWPPSPFCEKLLEDLDALDIARFCKKQNELTDVLLSDILASIEAFAARRSLAYDRMMRALERKALKKKRAEAERKRAEEEAKTRHLSIKTGTATADGGNIAAADDGDSSAPSVSLSNQEKRALQRRADAYAVRRSPSHDRTMLMLEREAIKKKRAEEEAKTRHLSIKTGTATADGGNAAATGGDNLPMPPVSLSEQEKQELQKQADEIAEQAGQEISATILRKFLENWKERVDAWKQIAEVFGDLGDLLRVNGRDLSRGILRSQGWLEIAKLRRLIEKIPQFKEVVQTLGRLQMSQDEDKDSSTKKIFELVRRSMEEIFPKPAPVPHEMRGIRRSDDIHRMLPQEAAFLGHPKLKMLWHARRAEQALLTYQMEGVMPQKIVEERDMKIEKEIPGERQKLERGPIICCLDTSSSMQGAPELAAKALTLEAMRLAHAEKRRCYLYAFSGPGNVVEHELKLTEEGLANFVEFLTLSFHGGTDIKGPMNQAIAKLEEEQWARADILLVTDGAINHPGEQIMESIRRYKDDKQLKIHGVLVGRPSNSAMDEICTHLHQFAEWMHIIGDR